MSSGAILHETRMQPNQANSALEEYERSGSGKPPFVLTYPEVKLLGIAGVCLHDLVNMYSSDLFILKGWVLP
jgi:hypothetical protein